MSFPFIISIKSSKISKFEGENIKKYKPFKFKIKKRPVYKPLRVKKPKPYKRGRLLKSGIIQHMRVTCTGRRYWTPKIIKIDTPS